MTEAARLADTLRLLKHLQRRPIRDSKLGMTIQENLIILISRAEWRIARKKKSIRAIREIMSASRLTKEEATASKLRVKQLQDSIDQDKLTIGFCRDIGDSIAFLYIDRWDIKPLFLKEPAGAITGKKGSRLERAIFRRIYKEGYRCLLNDLTGSIRFADITVFGPYGTFRLLEAKSGNGGNKKRAARQQADATAVMKYLITDKREFDGAPMFRRSLEERPRYHVKAANSLINQFLRGNGEQVFREVEPGVFYTVLGQPYSEELMRRFKRSEGPIMVEFCNNLKRKGEAYYPFPLSFDDVDTIMAFYAGSFSFGVMVDFTKVMRLSGMAGRIERSDDPHRPMIFYPEGPVPEDMPPHLTIGWHILNRLAGEFLSPRSFVRLIAQRYSSFAADPFVTEQMALPTQ